MNNSFEFTTDWISRSHPKSPLIGHTLCFDFHRGMLISRVTTPERLIVIFWLRLSTEGDWYGKGYMYDLNLVSLLCFGSAARLHDTH